MAAQIDKDFAGETIHMLVVLDGGCIFASDLVRALEGEVMLHFIKASSYGDRTTSGGRVRLKGGIQFEPKGEPRGARRGLDGMRGASRSSLSTPPP